MFSFCVQGYNSTESFNDKSMTQTLHSYCFQGPGSRLTQDLHMKEELGEPKLLGLDSNMRAAVDRLMGM